MVVLNSSRCVSQIGVHGNLCRDNSFILFDGNGGGLLVVNCRECGYINDDDGVTNNAKLLFHLPHLSLLLAIAVNNDDEVRLLAVSAIKLRMDHDIN